MGEKLFKVEDQFCEECALALRRFIGHEEGVESVDVENKMIVPSRKLLSLPSCLPNTYCSLTHSFMWCYRLLGGGTSHDNNQTRI